MLSVQGANPIPEKGGNSNGARVNTNDDPPNSVFSKYDTDKDGTVSVAEKANAFDAAFGEFKNILKEKYEELKANFLSGANDEKIKDEFGVTLVEYTVEKRLAKARDDAIKIITDMKQASEEEQSNTLTALKHQYKTYMLVGKVNEANALLENLSDEEKNFVTGE